MNFFLNFCLRVMTKNMIWQILNRSKRERERPVSSAETREKKGKVVKKSREQNVSIDWFNG